jgi:cytochrome c5
VSHEQTITVEVDGRHYVIPTVINGRKVSNEFAADALKAGSIPPLAVFSSAFEAEHYAQSRSQSFPEPDRRPSPANPKGGYDMKGLRKEVASARRVGGTDEDILSEIVDHPVLGPRIKAMLGDGKSPQQVLDALSGQDIVDDKYSPVEGMPPGHRMRAGMGADLARSRLGIIQLLESTASPERKAEIARQIEQMESLNKPIEDDPWGMGGSVLSSMATSAAPGSAAYSAAAKVLPKIDKVAGWGNRLARGSASLLKSAAGGVGGQAVVPESKPMEFTDYLDKAERGVKEGMIGDVAARVAGRVVKPLRFDIDPEYAKRLRRLYDAGIGKATPDNKGYGAFDLAQLTGDTTLRDLKSVLSKMPGFSGDAEKRTLNQLADYTGAVTSRTGTRVRDVSPTTVKSIDDNFKLREKEYSERMGPVDLDRPYTEKLLREKADQTPITIKNPELLKPIDDALDATRGGQLSMPSERALRERGFHSREAHRRYANRQPGAEAHEAVQDATDDAIERAFERYSPGAGEAWNTYRHQMRNFLDIKAAAGTPSGLGPGDTLNPKALAQVGRSENKKAMSMGGALDIHGLSDDAGKVLIDNVPNSGTPHRSLYTYALLKASKLASGRGISGAAGDLAQLGIGPGLAHHLLYGKGLLGKRHALEGLFGDKSDEAMRQMQEKFPGFTTALIERLLREQTPIEE